MKKRIGVGVIGTGQIAQIAHLPFLTELPEFDVRAICDLSQDILNTVGRRFGVANCYTDYRDLLKQPDIDAVLVSTVDHAEIAIAALNAGKHVMCEKPMAFNLEQCDAMNEAAARNGVKLMIAYMKRYDPAYQFALPLIHDIQGLRFIRVHDLAGDYHINNEIYDLVAPDDVSQETKQKALEVEREAKAQAIGQNRIDLVDAYGLLLGLCSHDSIVLHEAFGAPTKIQHVDVFANDCTVAVLEYGPTVRCVWESGFLITRPHWDEHLQVYGENRSLQVEFPFPYLKNAETYVHVNEMENGVNVQKKYQVSFDEAFKREWRHFYECVTEDQQPITDGKKGRRDIAFLIDLIKAARP
jgi:predicted dehydrogenase